MTHIPDAGTRPLALTASEVAQLLGVSRAHVWRLHKAGKLPEPVRLGRAVRWSRTEIESWLTAGAPARPAWERLNGPRQLGRAPRFTAHGSEPK